MKDLLRSYRLKLQHKGSVASDSEDTESQPLVSSSSSARSFGSVNERRCMFSPEDDSMSEVSESRRLTSSLKATRTFMQQETAKNQFNAKPPANTTTIAAKSFVRRPFCYPAPPSCENASMDVFSNNEAIYDRFQYFRKASGVLLDDQLIPSMLMSCKTDPSVNPGGGPRRDDGDDGHTHSSLVTIFAIWNTIIGSSLLAISWGLEKSGLIPGILLILLIAAICLYTSYVILKVNEGYGLYKNNEVPDLCRVLLGKWAEIVAKIVSLIVLIGANIVYWILMSNFLYNAVIFVYDYAFSIDESLVEIPIVIDNSTLANDFELLCPKALNASFLAVLPKASLFHHVWDLYSTVPVVLGILMFPLLNFKSATFFTKFNSLGTISVTYLILLVIVKGSIWGVHMPLNDWSSELQIKPNFSALSGMLSLSFFIHNIIISVCKNNKYQENNGRDISVAFGLATLTYLLVGVVFYVTFPLAKSCIEDNILNNLSKFDAMAMTARILLLFQLFTVFPLISFMLRQDITSTLNALLAQCFHSEKRLDFSYARVILINFFVVLICILFACFLPHIGTLIRYTGALSGMVYIFTLPSLLKIAALRRERALTTFKLVFHVAIVCFGAANLAMQFFIKDA